MDEAAQGPGPRDQEIPQPPGAADDHAPVDGASAASPAPDGPSAPDTRRTGDWTRNLTTVAVVARPTPRMPPTAETAAGPAPEPEPESEWEPKPQPAAEFEPEAECQAGPDVEPEPEAASEVAPADGVEDDAEGDLAGVGHEVRGEDESVGEVASDPGEADDEDAYEAWDDADTATAGTADTAADIAAAADDDDIVVEAETAIFESVLEPPASAPVPPVSGAKSSDEELGAWLASLGGQPTELTPKEEPVETPAEPAEGDAADKAEATGDELPPRRRLINPWFAAVGVAALLLAGTQLIDDPFNMATGERVPVSDVARMSDPEPPGNTPVNGGLPENLELPPVQPAAAPGGSSTPTASASAAPSSSRPATQASAPVVVGANGIPQIVLLSYQQAAEYLGKADPQCKLPWQLLAAIGRVESGHANGGQLDKAGTTLSPILGPRLDGTRNTRAIPDTDQGVLDFDREFDRAVGPMQFIPTSWKAYAMDGNKDGQINPQNVFDASRTAARYLCAGNRDLSTPDGLDKAVFSYNQSPEYVRSVKAWKTFYDTGVRAVPAASGTPSATSPASTAKAPTGTSTKSPTASKTPSKTPAKTGG